MSLYNNCPHQKWHLVITQYIEDYNECHSGGLSPGLLSTIGCAVYLGYGLKGPGVKRWRTSMLPKNIQPGTLVQKEIMIKTHCVGRDPYTNTTGFGLIGS